MSSDIMEKEVVRVAGISGSLRAGSYTNRLVALALQGAQARGAEVEMIDLREYDLVFCDGSKNEAAQAPDIVRLRRAVHRAQGIVLGTPEYHGSYSGVLKNALDLMGFDEFGGKVVGLVGVSGGAMGANNALNHLRLVGRSLHAWVLPLQVSVPQGWKQFDDRGQLENAQLAERLHDLGRQVAKFAYLHNSRQAQAFLRMWEDALPNPGGE